jgi:hypothetical protein
MTFRRALGFAWSESMLSEYEGSVLEKWHFTGIESNAFLWGFSVPENVSPPALLPLAKPGI